MDLLIPPAQQAALASMTDPLNFPTEYLGWLDDRIKQLGIQQIQKTAVGDYKVSAQTADHTDSAGGFWLICDGTSISASWTDLIALVGSTRPDARGRALVMQGTHTDVNAILKTEGVALANRTPIHNSTVTDAGHTHRIQIQNAPGAFTKANGTVSGATGGVGSSEQDALNATTGITVGAGGTRPIDTPAFIVPGNLFIHT